MRDLYDVRRDPEALLKKVEKEQRGKLTVFLGAAAGVGKTYAMLKDAKERLEEGTDIVIGWVETHGRKDTETMLKGLPKIAAKEIEYRGKVFAEMDTDEILRRKPQIVLVDELAHTNIQGLRHLRRFQDVEEILAAGIHVYTTINIQHIESLKDIVEHITGVKIWETVPDHVVENAEQVQLVDISPQTLLKRLQEGKVYIPIQAERAMKNFFREGNISALREMALRFTAHRVDQQMGEYMQEHAIAGPWPAMEKVLVCVSGSPFSAYLIRVAKRMATAMKSEWYALHIRTGQGNEQDEGRLSQNLRLAEELGGIVVSCSSRDIVKTMIDFSSEKNISHIIIGKPLKRHFLDWFRGGDIVDKLIKKSWGIQIHVIHGKKSLAYIPKVKTEAGKRKTRWQQYVGGFFMMFLTTVICWNIPQLDTVNVAMLYLLPVLLSAFWWGRGPSYFTAICAVIFFDVLFIPPLFSFSVTDIRYCWTFIIFLFVGFIAGGQTERLHREVLFAEGEEKKKRVLYEFSKDIAATVDLDKVVDKLVFTAAKMFQWGVAVFLPDKNGKLSMAAHSEGYVTEKLNANEFGVAVWAFEHGQVAGKFTDTVSSAECLYLPLRARDKSIGVLALHAMEKDITLEQKQLIEAWTNMAALAIERISLTKEASNAALLAESERLSMALLNSISHELKTPLATILGSASTLLDKEIVFDKETQMELYENIRSGGMRMERIINNLLDTARLESGAMKIKRDWCDIQDVVGTALQRLKENLGERRIISRIPPALPLIMGDCVLLEQVLVNLIDNANKYSPADAQIEITAGMEDGKILVSVVDYGEKISETDIDNIFNKFYRGKQKTTAPGTGLGLSICKGIIEAHGGTIWVVNLSAIGKRFVFSLPMEEKKHGT